jgi:hypothetical protein
MNSTIEIYARRLEHVLYLEEYHNEYDFQGNPFRFTTDRHRAKKFEHEDALRISNLAFDHLRRQLPKGSNVKQELSVYVNEGKKKKDDFPTWIALFLVLVLAYGLLRM